MMNSSSTYRNGRAIIMRGDARHLPLPDASVDLIVTSPPFWQLRSYTDNGVHYDGQLGSEPTFTEYLDSLLECTREWVRVLKPTGSLFVELGDKYSDRGHGPSRANGTGRGPQGTHLQQTRGPMEKCLLDLPARYSIRCVDELGLIKRANIVWHHTNGLPESVTDRVRASHSMVFHLVKQPRYYAAVDEIREAHTEAQRRGVLTWEQRRGRNDQAARYSDQNGHGGTAGMAQNPLGKLPGSVWEIPSQPLTVPAHLGVDHFAAFPMELPRRIILGWSPPGICVACGEGRRPVVDREVEFASGSGRSGRVPHGKHEGSVQATSGTYDIRMGPVTRNTITGYACACPDATAPTRPALVVDPFGGTGTTALVASMLGRTGVSFDLSADYCRLARWRTRDPAERARALGVPKPPPVPDGQGDLFAEVAP